MVGSVLAASSPSFSEVLGVRVRAGRQTGDLGAIGKETYKGSSGIYRREIAARRDDDNIKRLTRAAAVVLHRLVRVGDDEIDTLLPAYRQVSFHHMPNTVITSKTMPTTLWYYAAHQIHIFSPIHRLYHFAQESKASRKSPRKPGIDASW